MDLSLSISNRQITPAVVKVFQFENDTSTLTFTLDSYKHDQIDLRNYKAYAVTSINGQIDMTELTSKVNGSQLILTWQLQDYSLRQFGALQYQIVFKENMNSGENTAVFYSYKGIIIVRESTNADDHITANYPTLLKQWIDRINELAGTFDAAIIYMQPNQTLDISERLAGRIYYQIENTTTGEGHFEDHTGKRLGEFNAKYITNVDLNTVLEHGEYICGGTLTNMPLASTYCMLRVSDSGSTNRVIQEVYVPDNSNNVRVYARAVTGTDTFGSWRELGSADFVTSLLDDKDFEIQSLMDCHSKDLLDFYIETFDSTSSLTTIPDGHDSRLHLFNISGTSEMVFTTKTLSTARTQFWINVDFDNVASGSVTRQVSVDGGSNWVTITNNTITPITSIKTFIVKLKFSGSLTLKNVAFGLK